MKKLIFALMSICFIVTSCGNKVENLVSEYTSVIGKAPKQEGGVYTWENLTKEQFYKNGQTLKDKTDKILGFLPTESNEKEVSSATGDLYTSYVWENSNIRVCLWLDYLEEKESIQLIIKEK
ncbi:MAG: hypothetical protein [Bacteriophage sp.]|nr:MAG: hypothetical protein [Bacteriophage sp.]